MDHPPLILWDIYEIHTDGSAIHGVSLRGRIRKFGLEQALNILCENASDKENCVRFAVVAHTDPGPIAEFLAEIVPDHRIHPVLQAVANPVLSKLTINQADRYRI